MHRSFLKPLSAFALACSAAALIAPAASAAPLPPQSSQAAGVSISVQPMELSTGAPYWQFQVALNTHSGSLADDLAHTATLVDAAGKEYPPVAWEGDPAGGHHRRGVLRFKALSPQPAALQLRIQRAGEAAPRTFSWQLK